MKRPYLERDGRQIVNVNVSDDVRMPFELFFHPVEINGELYLPHPLGGGLVAASSYMPDEFSLDFDTRVAPDTRVLSNLGMAGQRVIFGDFRNPNPVSRVMDDEGRRLLAEQRSDGILERLTRIEARLAQAGFTGAQLL